MQNGHITLSSSVSAVLTFLRSVLVRVTPAGWNLAGWSRGTRACGGWEKTGGLGLEKTGSEGWFTSLTTTTRTACRYLKRWDFQKFQPKQVFVWWKKQMLPCLRWGTPSECRCGLWGSLEGWNTRDLWSKEERSVLVLDAKVTPEGVLLCLVCIIIRYSHS